MDDAAGEKASLNWRHASEVLIVEDNGELAAVISEMVSDRLAVNTACVSSVAAAIEILQRQSERSCKVVAIVSDYHLDPGTANTLLGYLNSEKLAIPVVLVTGAAKVVISPYPYLFGVCAKPRLVGLLENLMFLQQRPAVHG